MTDSHPISPHADENHIPVSPNGILNTLKSVGDYAATDDFRQRAASLQARLKGGERIAEADRAAALGMPYGAYALIRAAQIAREIGGTVHIDDDDGAPIILVEIVAGAAEFRRADRRLILAIDVDAIDEHLARYTGGMRMQ